MMDAYSIEKAFLYPTSMGNVSRVREPDYAVAFCEAYNDYVRDHYAKLGFTLSDEQDGVRHFELCIDEAPAATLPFEVLDSVAAEIA